MADDSATRADARARPVASHHILPRDAPSQPAGPTVMLAPATGWRPAADPTPLPDPGGLSALGWRTDAAAAAVAYGAARPMPVHHNPPEFRLAAQHPPAVARPAEGLGGPPATALRTDAPGEQQVPPPPPPPGWDRLQQAEREGAGAAAAIPVPGPPPPLTDQQWIRILQAETQHLAQHIYILQHEMRQMTARMTEAAERTEQVQRELALHSRILVVLQDEVLR